MTLGSVIIPAHNEAAVVVRCLHALHAGFVPGEIEVVLACNGCSDDTAERARATGHVITVLELATASKSAALRAADEVARVFPRIYLDADVVLPGPAARQLLEVLRDGSALAARPPISYDTSRSTAVVRSYYRARARTPSLMGSLWGAGTYGLSAAGRARFGPYPDVVAEDLFVDHQFAPNEIAILDGEPVVVVAPRSLRDLVTILRRTYRGKAEDRAASGRPLGHGAGATLRDVTRQGRAGPSAAIDATTYVACSVGARVVAKLARSTVWERDDSSRIGGD